MPADNNDRAFFNAATRVQIGDGRKASFWNSRWLQGEVPAQLYPSLYKHSRRKNRSVAEALHQQRWVNGIDYNLSQQLIAEFLALWEQLEEVVLTEGQKDRITWLLTSDGKYLAQSAYHIQFHGRTRCPSAAVTWSTKAPPKCIFFLWLMLQNRIWTAATLAQRILLPTLLSQSGRYNSPFLGVQRSKRHLEASGELGQHPPPLAGKLGSLGMHEALVPSISGGCSINTY